MKNLIFFLVGRFSSLFGNGLLKIVLPIYILEVTGSGASLGTFIALTALPSLLLTPLIGNYIEHLNRKYIMIFTDFIQFLLFLSMFLIGKMDLVTLAVFIVFSVIIEKIFDISSSSIFSQIVKKEYIEKGNSFKSILDNIAYIASPIIGTFIYFKFGIRGIFIINSITFLLSSISECFIKYTFTKVAVIKQSIIKNLVDVVDYISKNNRLNKLFIAIMLLNFIISPLSSVILPYTLLKVHGLSSYQFGIINSAYMVGSLLGASLIIFRKKNFNLPKLLNLNSLLFILIGGIIFVLLGKKDLVFVSVICFKILVGIVVSLVNIPLISSFQKMVPPEMQSRFFAILSFVGGLLIPLGEFIMGRLSEIFNPHFIQMFAGFIMIGLTYLLLMKNRKKTNELHTNIENV